MKKNIIKYFYLSVFIFLLLAVFFLINNKETTLPGNEAEYVKDNGFIFINTSKSVKYVGTEACKSCHKTSHGNVTHTEMYRSFEKLDSTNVLEAYPQKNPVYDSLTGFYYEMVRKDNRFYQREFKNDKGGNLIFERFVEAQYTIGSGNNLRMYFYNENGMLYQLPLTWYTYRQKWDLSPGYKETGNLRFQRYATKKCIGCHNSYMSEWETAIDRFKEPFSVGIGCERCHGPGEIHVKEMDTSNDYSLSEEYKSIVNPAKLSRDRMISVCMQCHLQGKAWAINNENGWFDFRPGQLLKTNRSVYFPEKTSKEQIEVGDSPHRLALSRCFQESNEQLTCITCHDPHYSIKSFTINQYNQKCLDCHPVSEFSQILHKHSIDDNCVSCHMNQTGKENTLHGVPLTDHWIRIDANKSDIDWTVLRHPETGPLVQLVPDIDLNNENSSIKKGIAYLNYYFEYDKRTDYLDSAINYLELNKEAISQSVSGNFALGEASTEKNNIRRAIAYYEKSIKINSNYADAYFKLGKSYYQLGDFNSAIYYFKKAVELKPDEPPYLENLANSLIEIGNINEAVIYLTKSISIDKFNGATFYTLGYLNAVNLQKPEEALEYFKKAAELDPLIEDVFLNLGNTYSLLGRYEEALNAYDKQIAFNPASASSYVNSGRIFQLTGDVKKAKILIRRALDIDPDLQVAKQFLDELNKKPVQ